MKICESTLLIVVTTCAGALSAQQDALPFIEGERGGRHWVDQQTLPPKSPEDSQNCLQIEPGFGIKLIAAEPLVRDPVAVGFDHAGRMFVSEYGDYPSGPVDGGMPLSRVVLLKDTDHDGQMDHRQVFADGLNFAHSLMPWKNGLLVAAQTEILFLKDSDGDDVADEREVLFTGFIPAHPQMQIGCPRWGMDNRIWLNYGPGSVASRAHPDTQIQMPQKDFSFHPQSLEFAADPGMGQYGNTFDRHGHRFYCTNRSPIITTLITAEMASRNPYAVITKTHYNVGRSGGETRVYPLVNMKSNYLSHAGTHTSACGVTAYQGDLLDGEDRNSVFVCEPIGHVVTRSVVEPDGLRLRARRARPQTDFLASTDTWFRPVSLSNGPDGALYLADMYRLWVEHPKFLPPEVANRLDWRAGEDRGRIYRIAPRNSKIRPFHKPATVPQTVAMLEDPNGWRRYLGQRRLIEQRAAQAVPLLRHLLHDAPLPATRLHALWTLDGLAAVNAADIISAVDYDDPYVRRDGIRLSVPLLNNNRVFSVVSGRLSDEDSRVRFQLALTLGNTDRPAATRLLTALALKDGHDEWFTEGLLTSTATRSAEIAAALVTDQQFRSAESAEKTRLLSALAEVAGARGNVDELNSLLQLMQDPGTAAVWWKGAIVSGLGIGLPRHRGDLHPMTLPGLIGHPPDKLVDSVVALREFLERARLVARDQLWPAADRAAAARLLTWRPFADVASTLDEMLAGSQPAEVRTAALGALSASGSSAAAEILLRRWPELGPSSRSTALAMLLGRMDWTLLLLQTMSEGKMDTTVFSIDQRVRLLKHSNDAIRSLATMLLGGAVSENRRDIVREYQAALNMHGAVESGRLVFRRTCSKCHIVDGDGHQAGPDISDVRNRSRAALLYDILDPNAKVEPRFTAYTIVTTDGLTINGLIASETPDAVVIQLPEGKQEVVGIGRIEQIQSGSASMMPEGIEKDLSPQDMADLLEFLTNRPPQTVSQ